MNDFQRDAESRYGGTVFNLRPVTQDPNFPRDGDSWFRVDLGLIKIKLVGVIYSLALLGDNNKLLDSELPDLAITDTFVVNSEAEMLAIDAQVGDVAIRTDENNSYILTQAPASTLSNWHLLASVSQVLSVNGKTGNVVLNTDNIDEGVANFYFTQARFDNNFSLKTTDDLTEGSLNLYFSNTRFDNRFNTKTTDNLTEGSANLYFTNARFDTRFNTKTTTNLAEGSNLYYTTARANTDFDARLATKSTSNLAEGSNLYYTTLRANTDFDNRLATKTTDNLNEGSINLYYTTARANADFDTRLATKTTSDLVEGSRLYYTTARANSDFDTRLATKTTDNLAEGFSNLYYTNTRFDTRFGLKTTSDLAEGANLYFTNARADARIATQKGVANGLATLDGSAHIPLSQISITTDDVPEGSNNLYYTDARADARIALQKGAANGIATLDSGSKIPVSQLPAIAITDTFVVASEAAMLALTAQTGDIAIRTDLSKSFVLQGSDPTVLANWQELLSPAAQVQSVNGFTGNVVLTTTDIAEGSNLYYTDTRARASISGISPILYNNANGQISIQKSDATHDGYLSQGDWSTFNSKEPAITAGTTLQYWRGDKTFQTLNTSAVPEGSNLYYTDARFDTRFASKSTTNLAEGTNLYFTNARARLAISATSPVLYDSSTGVISLGVVPIANGGTGATDIVTARGNLDVRRNRNSYVLVKSLSDLPAPSGGVITLADNTDYEINGTIAFGTNTLVVGTNCAVFGVNKNIDVLSYTGTGTFITISHRCRFGFLGFVCASGTLFNFSGSGIERVRMENLTMDSIKTLGTITGMLNLQFNTCNITNVTTNGFSISGTTNGHIQFINNFLQNNAGTFIALNSSTISTLLVIENVCIVNNSQIFLSGSSPTVTTAQSIANDFILTGTGTVLSGITLNDLNWFFFNNFSIDNTQYTGEAYMNSNATATVIGTAGTYVKALGTTTAGFLANFTHTTNRLTWKGNFTKTFLVMASLSAECANNGKTLSFKLAKNGVVINQSKSSVRISTTNQPFEALCKTLITLAPNDYIELWTTNETDTTNLTIVDLNLTAS